MNTNQDFTEPLRLVARSDDQPHPCSSTLTEIADFGDKAVPLLSEAVIHADPTIRRS